MFDDTLSVNIDSEESTPSSSRKAQRRSLRKVKREERQFRRSPKPLTPQTPNQTKYIKSINTNSLTISVGPPGVGKTYVAARVFGEWLVAGRIEKLYLARPNVSKAKHRNGFLPGDIGEKTAPWLVPIYEGIKESMSPSDFDRFKRDGKIEEVPFEFIQGRTFKDAACIIDEAENLDFDDLYITLTRQGEGLTMVLCGDSLQARIPDSGLPAVAQMAGYPFMEETEVVTFTDADVVRSKQAKQWVKAFNMFRQREGADRFGQDLPNFLRR